MPRLSQKLLLFSKFLLSSLVALSAIAPQSAFAQDLSLLVPHVVCSDYDAATGSVSTFVYATNNGTSDQLVPIGPSNYFAPGVPNQGQPVYFPVGRSDSTALSFTPIVPTDALTWTLGRSALQLTAVSVPCHNSFLRPNAISLSGIGSFPRQQIGTVEHLSLVMSATVVPAQANATISFSNVQVVPEIDASGQKTDVADIYADVTVASQSAATVPVLISFNAGSVQAALAVSTVSVSGGVPSAAGCPANVTSTISGTVGKAGPFLATSFWTQTVTIRNPTQTTIAGPIQLALTNLSSNAHLLTGSGVGTCPDISGAPYVTLGKGLAPGAYAAVVLTFTNSGVPNANITYTPVIVSGGQRL